MNLARTSLDFRDLGRIACLVAGLCVAAARSNAQSPLDPPFCGPGTTPTFCITRAVFSAGGADLTALAFDTKVSTTIGENVVGVSHSQFVPPTFTIIAGFWPRNTPVILPCDADVDDGSFLGVPDGGVTIEDLLFFLSCFDEGRICADVDDGFGLGNRDGGITIEDLLYFLFRFDSGC